MANYYGRAGAPMIQPRKDEYRGWLHQTQRDLKDETRRRSVAEYKLSAAMRVLGALVLDGTITVSLEKLGELALDGAMEEEANREKQKLLAE
jgi:hypothetical protein